ncbi:TPA: hypothetical protein EYP66_09940 [Candidatus Poribacteria bacterium]|nr:hypothetical protein [Candidatus Poribacteria bacterium]
MRLKSVIISILVVVSFIFISFWFSSDADAQRPQKRSTMVDEIINAYFENVGNLILLISTDVILANANDSRNVGGYLTKYNFGELFAIGSFIIAVSLSIDLESAKSVYTLGELSGGGKRSWEQTLASSSISPFLGGAVGLLLGGAVEQEPLVGGIIGFALGSILSPVSATIGYNQAQPTENVEKRRFGRRNDSIPSDILDFEQSKISDFTVTIYQKRF